MTAARSAVLLAAALAALGACAASATAQPSTAPPTSLGAWTPDVAAARAYAATRPGAVSFAVRTNGRFFGHQTTRSYASASVFKAMLLVAYLRRDSVRSRSLTRGDRAVLSPMIRRSDDTAASRAWTLLGGDAALRRLARRARMQRFVAGGPVWGTSRVDARDQTRFFLGIERLTPPRHRAYAMRLLRTIVRSQRWGIGKAVPPGWSAHFKGGWGSGTGAVNHQVALLTRGRLGVSVAVLTAANGTHGAGKVTLRGVFRRLLAGLDRVRR